MADAEQARDRPHEIIVAVAADGRYAVNKKPVDGRSVEALAAELAAAAAGSSEMMLIVSADATAAHQSVINVMDAARRAGIAQADLRDPVVGRRRALTRMARAGAGDACARGRGDAAAAWAGARRG